MEVLLEIREEMSREVDYDVDLFAEMIRSGKKSGAQKLHDLNGITDGEKTVSVKRKKSSDRSSLN